MDTKKHQGKSCHLPGSLKKCASTMYEEPSGIKVVFNLFRMIFGNFVIFDIIRVFSYLSPACGLFLTDY